MSRKKRLLYFIAFIFLVQGTSLIILDVYGKFLIATPLIKNITIVIVTAIYTTIICTYQLRIRLTSSRSRASGKRDR